MRKLNIDFLLNTPVETLVEKIDFYFNKLIQEIETYLSLEPLDYKIEIVISDEEEIDSKIQSDIFSIGVHRIYEKDVLTIQIQKNFYKFIPIILLREAYRFFIPFQASQLKTIDIFINQKVMIDLEKLKSIKEWELFTRNNLIDYEFISKEFNRLENFLKRESTDEIDSPFIFFFKYIRKNIQIISEKTINFYDDFFEEYLLLSSKSMLNDDEIIETVRVLNKIFDEVKYYTALLDYQHYFREFKKRGMIQTDLSLNKFTENMQWIKQFSTISPSYIINWSALKLYSIDCYIKFNPILKRTQLNQILKELPFFVLLKESRNSFSLEMDGFFVIPSHYFNDLKNFLAKLEDNGYIQQYRLIKLEKVKTFSNLNYFREYLNKKSIVNREHKDYDKKYELSNSINYGDELHGLNLSLLDWLIIDRIRYYSQVGFNFERRSGTLKLLKSDLVNEVISQRKFIEDLKSTLLIFHSSTTLKDSFLEFLKANENFGFFYIRDMLLKYVTIFDLINEILTGNPSIKSVFEFFEFIERSDVLYSIENNIIFNKPQIREHIFKQFLPMYFKSKESFEKEIEKFTNFNKIFNSCHDLKIFNLQSIRMIVQNKSLVNTIFRSKEKKLKSSYENYQISDITYQLIENKLETFLNNI
ncbi:MAG: hypothetical protein ACFFD7_15465, partial [Candidatus Thorarchaeota archaeon]